MTDLSGKLENVRSFLYYRTKNLKNMGKPINGYDLFPGAEDIAIKLNKPLFNFYLQFIDSIQDPNVQNLPEKVYSIYYKNKYRSDKVNEAFAKISKSAKYLKTKYKTPEEKQKLAKQIDEKLEMNPLTEKLVVKSEFDSHQKKKGGAGARESDDQNPDKALESDREPEPEPEPESERAPESEREPESKPERVSESERNPEREPESEPKLESKPDSQNSSENCDLKKNFYERMACKIRGINKQDGATREDDLNNLVEEIKEDPIYGEEIDKITITDRVVFIVITYIIRAISLFLIDWALNSTMVTNIKTTFMLYVITYISIFLIWVLLVNSSNEPNGLFIRMLFYYVDTKANSYMRIIIHLLIQVALLPIMILIKTKTSSDDIQPTFEDRRKISQVLTNLSLFSWLITSIVALQY